MKVIDKLWKCLAGNHPFVIHMPDGESYLIKDRSWVGAHPSGKSPSIIVYGPGENEQHTISIYSIKAIEEA